MGRWLAIATIAASLPLGAQSAAACDGGSDNPMVSSESFGVAGCKQYAPRYHTRDYVGEGARGYTRYAGDDPMVWSDDQWRSSLMSGYARDYDNRYDFRFRRAGGQHVVKRIERVIIMDEQRDERMVVKPRARGPKIVTLGGVEPLEHARSAAHQCRGALILTWKAAVPRSKCVEHGPRDRVRRVP